MGDFPGAGVGDFFPAGDAGPGVGDFFPLGDCAFSTGELIVTVEQRIPQDVGDEPASWSWCFCAPAVWYLVFLVRVSYPSPKKSGRLTPRGAVKLVGDFQSFLSDCHPGLHSCFLSQSFGYVIN